MKKRKSNKSYGKTAKQWDVLYNKYKAGLKNRRDVIRMNKTEFKEAWTNRKSGETVNDLVRQSAMKKNFNTYETYELYYSRLEKRKYGLGDKYTRTEYLQQLEEYGSAFAVAESHRFVSEKQGKAWMKKYKQLKEEFSDEIKDSPLENLKITDFYKEDNEKADAFWDFIDEHGGWNEVFHY